MAREGIALPPPTIFGSKLAIQQLNQIHIQVPCQIFKFVADKWDLIAANVLVQLVKETSQSSPGVSSEYLRVLDVQSQHIVNQLLTELKWSQLTDLTYELDALRNEELDEVYAITFFNAQEATHFNKVFQDKNKQSEVSSNALTPFLVPLTDAILRGDVEEAMKRFKYLCEFPPEQRKFSIRAETPLTPEQVKLEKSININITVENYEGKQTQITLCVPKESSIADLKEIMYIRYEIPLEVQKWLGDQCLYKNSDRILNNNGEPKIIYLYILNAAKVGLNRGDFMAKLEAYRNSLNPNKLQATVIDPRQQQQQQQQQQPMHEDDVPIGPPITPFEVSNFALPVVSKPVLNPSSQNPNAVPFNPNINSAGSSVPSGHEPTSQQESGQSSFIPGVLWTCSCKHVNAWENIRCERCRKDRDQPI